MLIVNYGVVPISSSSELFVPPPQKTIENQYCHLAVCPAGQPSSASAWSSAAGEWLIYSVWKKLLHTLFTVKCFNNQFSSILFQRPILFYLLLHTESFEVLKYKLIQFWWISYILRWFFINKFQLSQSLKSF